MSMPIVGTILTDSSQAYASLTAFAQRLFVALAVLQFTLMVLMHLISQRDISGLWGAIGKSLFITGMFYLLMTHAGSWSFDLLQGVMALGTHVDPSLKTPSPMGLVQMGARISSEIVQAASARGIFESIGLTLLALFFAFFILIVMALMAADLAVTYGKFYLVIAVSGILIALGAFEPTREVAKNYYRALLGLGLQLLVTFVVLAIFSSMSSQWTGMFYTYAHDLSAIKNIWMIPMQLLIFYMLVKTVPPFIAQLSGIGGFANHGEQTVMMAAGAAALGAKIANPANHINKAANVFNQHVKAGKSIVSGVKALGKVVASPINGAAAFSQWLNGGAPSSSPPGGAPSTNAPGGPSISGGVNPGAPTSSTSTGPSLASVASARNTPTPNPNP